MSQSAKTTKSHAPESQRKERKRTPDEQRAENERVAREHDADDLVVDAVTASTAARIKASKEVLDHSKEAVLTSKARIAANTARYEALAREHGADLGEEGFNDALRKVGRAKPA